MCGKQSHKERRAERFMKKKEGILVIAVCTALALVLYVNKNHVHKSTKKIERPISYIEIGDTVITAPAGTVFSVYHFDKQRTSKHHYKDVPTSYTKIRVLKTNEIIFFSYDETKEIFIKGHPHIKSLHNEVNKWGRKILRDKPDSILVEEWNSQADTYL